MHVARRTLAVVVVVAPLVALATLGLLMLRRYEIERTGNLAGPLSAEITAALGHEVSVGRVTLTPDRRRAILDDVRIAEGRTLTERGAIASARRVILDFDAYRALFERNSAVPRFGRATVYAPVMRISRNRSGVWNFADILAPRPGPPGRPLVGEVELSGGTLYYYDAALAHNPRRPGTPVRGAFNRVAARVTFRTDKITAWAVEGRETTGQATRVRVTGTYSSTGRQTLVQVSADDVALPLLNRVLPPEETIAAGRGSGTATLSRAPNGAGPPTLDYQATVAVTGGSLATARLAEPVRGIHGRVTLTDQAATGQLDGELAGSPMHAEGTVLGAASAPVLDGWVSGRGVSLARILNTLRLAERYPALRELQASGDVRAAVKGPPRSLSVSAGGPVRLRGAVASGASLPQQSVLQLAVTGPVSAPTITATGTLPEARFREYTARNVWLSGIWTPQRGAADFAGEVAGGRVTGRALVLPGGPGAGFRYQVVARGRRIDVGRLPLRVSSRRAGQPGGPTVAVAGLLDMDVAADGRTGGGVPGVRALVQGTALQYGRWRANEAQASVHTSGRRLYVDSLDARGPTGAVAAVGTADLNSHALDMQVSADSVSVRQLLEGLSAGEPGGPGAGSGPLSGAQVSGYGFVRNGHLSGTWDDPRFEGQVRAYDLAIGSLSLDFAQATIAATRREIAVESAGMYRFPAVVQGAGTVADPFGPEPRVRVSGHFEDVEAWDVSQIAESPVSILGTAHGSFAVTGTLPTPSLDIDPIVVEHASAGSYDFDSASGSIHYSAGEEGGTWRADARAVSSGATLTAKASLVASGRFHLEGEAEGIDVSRFGPTLAPYAVVQGSVAGSGSVDGVLQEWRSRDAAGRVQAHTTGLTVNGVSLGELAVAAPVAGGAIGPVSGTLGPPDHPIARITDIAYERASQRPPRDEDLRVVGSVTALPLETARRLVAGSPWVAEGLVTPAEVTPAATDKGSLSAQVARLLAGRPESPVQGSVDGGFRVTGPLEGLTATVSWHNHDEWTVHDQTVQAFSGEATFARGQISVKDARLQTGDMEVTASAAYTSATDQVVADLRSGQFSLEKLRRWLPSASGLDQWSGTASALGAHLEGPLRSLQVALSADNADLRHVVRREGTERSVHLTAGYASIGNYASATGAGGIRLRDGVLTVEDVVPSAAGLGAAPPSGQRSSAVASQVPSRLPPIRSTTVSIPNAAIEFYWQLPDGEVGTLWKQEIALPGLQAPLRPYIPADPAVALSVQAQRQGLAALGLALPGLREAGGTVDANLVVAGHLHEPEITGTFALAQAGTERIAYGNTGIALRGLDVLMQFAGSYVEVARFRGETQPFGLGDPRLERPSEPFTMDGRLALTEARAESDRLHLVAKRVGLAIAPLPDFKGGRFVTDDLSADITIGGTLTRPAIMGSVDLRNADLRIPAEPTEEQASIPLPIVPTFNLALNVGANVRVSSAQMNAVVRTEPNAPILLATGATGQTRLEGTLVLDTGALMFPTARFAIQPGGEANLQYPYLAGFVKGEPQYVLGVSVNLTATTHLSAPSVTGEVRRYTIYVQATGPINVAGAALAGGSEGAPITGGRGLQLAFRSDPPDLAYTQAGLRERITGLLGGQQAISSLFSAHPDVARIFGEQVTDILSASLLPDLLDRLGVARALRLEEFAVEYNRLDAFVLRLSRRLIGPFYISFWQRLSAANRQAGDRTAWELKLSYHIRHNLQFSWTIDDQRSNAYLLEGVYRF